MQCPYFSDFAACRHAVLMSRCPCPCNIEHERNEKVMRWKKMKRKRGAGGRRVKNIFAQTLVHAGHVTNEQRAR